MIMSLRSTGVALVAFVASVEGLGWWGVPFGIGLGLISVTIPLRGEERGAR